MADSFAIANGGASFYRNRVNSYIKQGLTEEEAKSKAFIDFKELTEEAQQHIVNNTFEYPIIEGVEPHPLIKKMGENFKQDLKTKVEDYKKNQADALEVMLMSGWK